MYALEGIFKGYGETDTDIEAEFLDKIQTKVLIVLLLAIHSYLYSFALRFPFLQTLGNLSHISSNSLQTLTYFYSSVTTVHCKEERRKT